MEIGRWKIRQFIKPRLMIGLRRLPTETLTINKDRGIQGFDETCAAQAGAAGLPGAYKALVATDGASAISRFDLNGPPWVRPDGVAIVARAADLADGKLIAPLDVHADSKGDADVFSFWTGAPTPGVPGSRETTCNAWTSISTYRMLSCRSFRRPFF